MRFVNLHHHSTFSFRDGFGTPAQHVQRAAELGYSAIALTEHGLGNVSSHFQLEKAARKAGIRALFGLEAYCGPVGKQGTQLKNHLTVVARTLAGYQNLNRIVTQSYLDFFHHPTVSGASLGAHAKGLTVLSGCSGSLLACTLLGGKGIPEPEKPDIDAAIGVVERFQQFFGPEYFLEVQPFWELERTSNINTAYELIAMETGARLVVTGDVHYPRMEDSEMQAILHATRRGNETVEDQMQSWNYEVPLTLPASDKDLAERLIKTGLSKAASWGAIETSAEIAQRCDVTLPKASRLEYPVSERDLIPWKLDAATAGRS